MRGEEETQRRGEKEKKRKEVQKKVKRGKRGGAPLGEKGKKDVALVVDGSDWSKMLAG